MSPPEIWGPPVWTFFHTLAEKLNEDYLSALMKFDHLHKTLSDMIGGEIHETMSRVQNHIKMFKKADGKGLFSVERLNENK